MTVARASFVTGINEVMQDWTSGIYRAMLLDTSWDPDPSSDVFVDDVVAFEFAAPEYLRQTLTGATRAVQLPATQTAAGYVVFDCDDVDFGVMSGDDQAAYLAVYKFVTGDADSPLVAAFLCSYVADGVAAATFTVSVNGLYRDSSLCDSAFS